MKNRPDIVFLCDYRASHAQKWIAYFQEQSANIHVISTHPVEGVDRNGFSCLRRDPVVSKSSGNSFSTVFYRIISNIPSSPRIQNFYQDSKIIKDYLTYRNRSRQMIKDLNPRIVHSLRIQPAGLLGRYAATNQQFFLSTWGQDLVIYRNNPLFTHMNRWVLGKVSTLFVDAELDMHLADFIGLTPGTAVYNYPARGGLSLTEFEMHYDSSKRQAMKQQLFDSSDLTIFVAPRGFGRRYVLNELLIDSISLLRRRHEKVLFLIAGNFNTPGYWRLKSYIEKKGVSGVCKLVSYSYKELMDLFKLADFYVSLTTSDGTPMSMLEAMAQGSVPIVSDLRFFQPWINDGINGFLADLNSAEKVAETFSRAIKCEADPRTMAEKNFTIVREKADWAANMKKIEKIYEMALRQAV